MTTDGRTFSAYTGVLEPLFRTPRLAEWEGVRWRDAHLSATQLVIGQRAPNNAMLLLTLFEAKPSARLQAERWAAITLWTAWARTVANAQGHRTIPPDWYIVTPYPGEPYLLPRTWINEARNQDFSWDDWMFYAQIGVARLVPFGPDTIPLAQALVKRLGEDAVRAMLAEPKVEPPEPAPPGFEGAPRGRGRPRAEPFPGDWERTLELLSDELKPSSLTTMRSVLRRIVREAGSHEAAACSLAAAAGTPHMRSVWNRFCEARAPRADTERRRIRTNLTRHGRAHAFDRLEIRLA